MYKKNEEHAICFHFTKVDFWPTLSMYIFLYKDELGYDINCFENYDILSSIRYIICLIWIKIEKDMDPGSWLVKSEISRKTRSNQQNDMSSAFWRRRRHVVYAGKGNNGRQVVRIQKLTLRTICRPHLPYMDDMSSSSV